MQIAHTPIDRTCDESEVYNALFDFTGKRILELGCGAAAATRAIAKANPGCHIDAFEVDTIQHEKNLQISDLPNVTFKAGGAERINAPVNTYDIVFMFKSLHHVPIDQMDQAMAEIRRVLKPGGAAYISEPVFAGAFNEVMRLFHDEQRVREHAFAAVKRAVDNKLFTLKDEIFFNTVRKFESFKQFEDRVIGVTFVQHRLDEATWKKVKAEFEKHLTATGAVFKQPIRVDLVVKG